MSDIDETMYRMTVAQRDAAWREAEQWQRRYDALLRLLMDQPALKPPTMLAHAESYQAGHIKGVADERERIAKLFDGEVWGYDYREIAARIRSGEGV